MALDDKKDCEAFVQGYVHDGATVLQMQKYAHCVDILYPQTITEHQYLLLSSFGLLTIITMVLVAYLFKREKPSSGG
jgi:hypothetical protein